MARRFSLNPHTFIYGSMHFYVLLVVMVPIYLISELFSASHAIQATLVYLGARSLSALFGAGCVVLTYLLAQRLFERTVALLSALSLSLAVGFVSSAHFATVDVPMLFWMMASYLMSAKVLEGDGARSYALAGAFAGFAAGTKYVGGLALLGLIAAYLLGRGERNFKSLLFGILSAFVAFLIVNPSILLDSCEFFEGFILDNAFNVTFGSDRKEEIAPVVLQRIFEASGFALGIAISLAVCYAVLQLMVGRKVREIVFVAVLIVPFFLMISNVHYASVRHVLPMVPPLLILVGKMLADLVTPGARQARRWVGYGLIAATVLYSALDTLAAELKFTYDARELAATWIEERLPPGSTIEVTLYGPALPPDRFVVEKRPYLSNLTATVTGLEESPIYRALHPIYRAYAAIAGHVGLCEPGERHYLGWYERAEASASTALATFDPSIEGLEARAPDLLVVSSLYYGRFTDDPTGPDGRFFRRLFAGEGSYRQVAEFRYGLAHWLDPAVEFINPTVRIFAKSDDTDDERG